MAEQETVRVRRGPQDSFIAEYRLCDVWGLHYDCVTGGIGVPTNRTYLFGYVQCDAMIAGELAHSCSHGPPPHRIKVCITKTGNDKQTYARLAASVVSAR